MAKAKKYYELDDRISIEQQIRELEARKARLDTKIDSALNKLMFLVGRVMLYGDTPEGVQNYLKTHSAQKILSEKEYNFLQDNISQVLREVDDDRKAKAAEVEKQAKATEAEKNAEPRSDKKAASTPAN